MIRTVFSQYRRFAFLILVVLVVFWALFVYYAGLDSIIETLGISYDAYERSNELYAMVFFIALLGGFSAWVSTPFLFTALFALSALGLNPFLLGFLGGIGMTVGDSFFFYLGNKGRVFFGEMWRMRSQKLASWLQGRPRYVIPFFVFGYAAFVPLPNDILTVALAFLRICYRNIFIPILLGNITLATLVGLSAHIAIF